MNAQTSIGFALGAVSFALVVLARLQLGNSFAVTPAARDLVTHGLYSRLRHPMYLFVDSTVCGIALPCIAGMCCCF
jgi:protein-S-isoprenylcysteine O-methyltransferase Ste14